MNGNTTEKRGDSAKVLYIAFTFFFLYPFFRDILPINDVFWFLSVMAGLFICAYCSGLELVISPTKILWFALAMIALGSFLILGADETVLPKRMGLYLVSMLMMILFCRDRKWVRPAIISCLILLSIHAVATIILNSAPGLYERYIAPSIQGSSVTVVGPKSGLTSHYSYNGQIMAIGLLISYVLFKMSPFQNGKRFDRIKYGILTIIFMISLLLTTKRAPLLICFIAIILTEYLLATRGKVATLYKILLLVYLVAIAAIAFGDQISILSNIMDRLSVLFTASSLEESTTGRTFLWDRAIQLWSESPIFGSGWGTYRYYWVDGYQGVSIAAHNVFLQLLAEVGIVGLVLFLIPSLSILFGLFKTVSQLARGDNRQYDFNDAATFFAFLFQVYFFIYCFVGAPLYDFESFPVYFVLSCGVWYAMDDSDVKIRKRRAVASMSKRSIGETYV